MSSFLENDKKLIDNAMDSELVSESSDFKLIVEAMRYSALGGKRLRGFHFIPRCLYQFSLHFTSFAK